MEFVIKRAKLHTQSSKISKLQITQNEQEHDRSQRRDHTHTAVQSNHMHHNTIKQVK